MWVPVHNEEWDGDIPIGKDSQINSPTDEEGLGTSDECGTVVFKGGSLPWTVGQYEVRYHHDMRYNVLALDGPIEIYGTFHASCHVYFALLIVCPQWTAQQKSTLSLCAQRSPTSSHYASTVTLR
jgi:hypothetical protein